MLVTIAFGLGGLILLYLGGEALIKGASTLAIKTGISPLVMGLTVVAFGTSAPELVVSTGAALTGANDISLGNVVGSNIANIALILGLSILIKPAKVTAQLIRMDGPIMVGASLVLVALLASVGLPRWAAFLLLACLVGYIFFTLRQARRESQAVQEVLTSVVQPTSLSSPKAVSLVLGGLAMLVLGGNALVDSAVTLATALGVSEAVIGLTIVSIGTSLPELATSVLAALRGQADIAVGNVVGSNIFNILGILGITAMIHPLVLGGITWTDLSVMLALALLVMILMVTDRRLERWEGGVLLASYVGYTSWLITG